MRRPLGLPRRIYLALSNFLFGAGSDNFGISPLVPGTTNSNHSANLGWARHHRSCAQSGQTSATYSRLHNDRCHQHVNRSKCRGYSFISLAGCMLDCCRSCLSCQSGSRFLLAESLWSRHKCFCLVDLPLIACLPLALVRLLLSHLFAYLLAGLLIFGVLMAIFHITENSLLYAIGEPPQSRIYVESPANVGFTCWEKVSFQSPSNIYVVLFAFLVSYAWIERHFLAYFVHILS
ncbi:unnamed protein product [Protopolystoma xenopodis]|uniref:Uncharacterized protein n=1 Tax=Protopolystoma xenopodis TaxID=117903 RepID=A0A3S5B4E1_9PLAT|nr:unnamed protein product [Protopolystoma xenopodis]